jgi:hypothetical protein
MQGEDLLPESPKSCLVDGHEALVSSRHSSSEWSPTTLCAVRCGSSSSDTPSTGLEKAARSALDIRAGRALTDGEWAQTRARLLEFAIVVRSWDQTTKLCERGLGNV